MWYLPYLTLPYLSKELTVYLLFLQEEFYFQYATPTQLDLDDRGLPPTLGNKHGSYDQQKLQMLVTIP